MATRQQFLTLMRELERDLDSAFAKLSRDLTAIVGRYLTTDNEVRPQDMREMRRVLGMAMTEFVFRGDSPFTVDRDGDVRAESVYMAILWAAMRRAMQLAVEEQAALMRPRFTDAQVTQLERATLNPFTRDAYLPAQETRVLNRYQHPLVFRREDGRLLEDRLVVATQDMIRKTSQQIETMITQRLPLVQIGDSLERYFQKTKGGERGAMALRRIARSEPGFAFGLASVAAGATNPIVTTVRVRRGRSVPCSICDAKVANNPYTLDTVPFPQYHAHCLCYLVFETERGDARIQEYLNSERWLETQGALSTGFIDKLLRLSRDRGE